MTTITLRRISDLAHRLDVAHDHVLSHFIGDIIYFHVESFRAPNKEDRASGPRSYRLMNLAGIADFFVVASPQATIDE